MPGCERMTAVLVLVSVIVLCAADVQYEFVEEWKLWKTHHGKSYGTELEELERHLVWLSNKKYIESHNNNAHVFGYTLAMNSFGDMVGKNVVPSTGSVYSTESV